MNEKKLDEFMQSIARSAEICSLSIALQGKPTCAVCGMFATVDINETSYHTRDGSVLYCPDFCDRCKPNDVQTYERPGNQAARRLNKLLRGE